MCIIMYAKRKELIKPKTLKNCFENNPDGAGFMFRQGINGAVTVRKGFMDYDALQAAVNALPATVEIALHCRIATSGRITSGLCHPFPVSDDFKEMRRTEGTYKAAMVHNGIISFCEPKEGIKATYSDTMYFVKHYVKPMLNIFHTPETRTLLERACTSRFLLFEKGKEACFMGNWVKAEECQFSNTSYLPYSYEWTGYNWQQGGKDMEEDIYTLLFTIKDGAKMKDTDQFNLMLDILDELDTDYCFPDYDGADCYNNGNDFIVKVCTLQVPVLNKVKGHKWKVLTNTYPTTDENPAF